MNSCQFRLYFFKVSLNLLSKRKGKKSFSQVIKENLTSGETKADIMSFAGVLKNDKRKLELLKSKIAAEREANYGRALN